MLSKQIVPSVLMAVILLLSVIRLFLLYRFGSKWSAYKVDYAVGTTSCILFAVLSGLFWSKQYPAWSQILLWLTTIFPPLQVFLRINYQQRRFEETPRMLLIAARAHVILSSIAKLAIALIGHFILDSVYQGGLFILCADYFGVAIWYWWLLGRETEGQVTFRRVLCYISVMTLILLVFAITGIQWVSWVVALEAQLITIYIWASFERLVV
ncbi:hypothetical protein N7451_012466 [Penicillium sp. IBT 35674x]|nr:hypothetical protein N7451_012466 [Penicillium sp. IBT 35674x]